MELRAKGVGIASLVLACGLGGCGGCGGSDRLDSGKLQKDLHTSLQRTTNAKVGDVSCPSKIKIAKGAHTTCTTSNAAGQKVLIQVTQTDGNGHVRYVVG
jgi:hypothetical protein